MRTLLSFLCVAICVSVARGASDANPWKSWPPEEKTPSPAADNYQAVADPRGGFWLLNARKNAPELLRYLDGNWTAQEVTIDGRKMTALTIRSCDNGRVAGIFSPLRAGANAPPKLTVAELTPDGWKAICDTIQPMPDTLYLDKRGRVWWLFRDKEISWFEDGKWRQHTPDYRPADAAVRRGGGAWTPPQGQEVYSPCRIVETQDGALWFWSDAMASRGRGNLQILDGMLVYERGQWTQYKDVDDNDRLRFGAGAILNRRLLVAGTPDGIAVVDVLEKSRQQIPVLENTIGRGFAVPAVRRAPNSDTIWIVAQPTMAQAAIGEFRRAQQSGWQGELWRFDGEELTQIAGGLDLWGADTIFSERPLQAAPGGALWAGTNGGGAIMADGRSFRRFDWRDGLRLSTVEDVVISKDGEVLLLHHALGCAVASADAIRAPQRVGPSRWRYEQAGDITMDAQGNFWTVRGFPAQLMKFDGKEWSQPFEMPAAVDLGRLSTIAVDSRGLFWFFSRERPVGTFDGKDWTTHDSMPRALEAQMPLPKDYNLPIPRRQGAFLRMADGGFWLLEGRDRLHYFDGKNWEYFSVTEMEPDASGFSGALYLGSDGKMRLRARRATWTYADGDWKQAEAERTPLDLQTEKFRKSIPPQQQWPAWPVTFWPSPNDAERIAEHGSSVFVLGRQGLYRFADGCWGALDSSPNPMSGFTQILDARVDRAGALWVRVTRGSQSFGGRGGWTETGTWIVFSGYARAPETKLIPPVPNQVKGAEVTFVFDGTDTETPRERMRFSWRVDDGSWSAPVAENSVTVKNLAPGKHKFAVRALDQDLNYDSSPAEVEFVVTP